MKSDLKHLQHVILLIVKDIDELCRKNGIEYYLFGGSAIGAIRHKGFIPWDDDLDIIMDHTNYDKFVKVCREQLNTEKYYFQQGLVDWPMMFSKVRLKGTVMDEAGAYGDRFKERGIFVDVFQLYNSSSNRLSQIWQYVCAKYFLCYCLLKRGYKEASIFKKMMMYLAFPLKIRSIRKFIYHQIVKYDEDTTILASFGARFRFKNSFFEKELYSNPIYVDFEDTKLPVPEKYDSLLRQIYGDYMTPPPVQEQVGWHLQNVDFGKY